MPPQIININDYRKRTLSEIHPPPYHFRDGLQEVFGQQYFIRNISTNQIVDNPFQIVSFGDVMRDKNIVGLFFCKQGSFEENYKFHVVLQHVYREWKNDDEKIEIVAIPLDRELRTFKRYFSKTHGNWVGIHGTTLNQILYQ